MLDELCHTVYYITNYLNNITKKIKLNKINEKCDFIDYEEKEDHIK